MPYGEKTNFISILLSIDKHDSYECNNMTIRSLTRPCCSGSTMRSNRLWEFPYLSILTTYTRLIYRVFVTIGRVCFYVWGL